MTDHVVTVSRFPRGHSIPGNRVVYGTALRCRCGWHDKNNEPPSKCQPWIRKTMAAHKKNPDPNAWAWE